MAELCGVPLNVPVAWAVLVCDPGVIATGPATQVMMWLSFAATATGRVTPEKLALQVETSMMLSVMLIGFSGTSPVFSTVKR